MYKYKIWDTRFNDPIEILGHCHYVNLKEWENIFGVVQQRVETLVILTPEGEKKKFRLGNNVISWDREPIKE